MRFSLLILTVALWHTATAQKCPARTEKCMNDRNFAVCKQLEHNGCASIRIQHKACPLRFTCATAMVPPPTPAPLCPARTSACINEENHNQCLALVKAGCQQPLQSKSCPVQFSCGNVTVPPLPPTNGPCPPLTDTCMTKELHLQCQALVSKGCTSLVVAKSCPYASFGRAHELPVPAPTPLCPTQVDRCTTAEGLEQCQSLVKAGCQQLIMSKSCPGQFFCGNVTVLPTPPPLCPTQIDQCTTLEALTHCRDLVNRGCQQPLMAKSCPVQFSCGDEIVPTSPLCPTQIDPCTTAEGLAQCHGLVKTGCQQILVSRSCPTQFSCLDTNGTAPPMPPQCPTRVDDCTTLEGLAQCRDLVKAGCKQPLMSKSCPAQFFCVAATSP